jgi:hypothetical protein
VSASEHKRRLGGPDPFSNWVWTMLVLALIGIVVWGWAFDFTPR